MSVREVIIVPFQLPWDWSADYQRQTCVELAKTHTVIAYFSFDARFLGKQKPRRSFRHPENIIIHQPTYLFPFRRFPVVEEMNAALALAYAAWKYGKGLRRVTVWVFDAVFRNYPLVRFFYPRTKTVYDCVDYVWEPDSRFRTRLQEMERRLIRTVTYFFVNSRALERHHRAIRVPNKVVPQGFRQDDFVHAGRSHKQFSKTKPVIGYVGALDTRLDMNLLTGIIDSHPEWHFVLWGPVQSMNASVRRRMRIALDRLRRRANVTIGKSKNPADIPAVIAAFDVAMIPYDTSFPSVRNSYPMKVFEYFYMGKPVISTGITELSRFSGLVYIRNGAAGWGAQIAGLLSTPWPEEKKRRQRHFAERNSWKKKVGAITRVLRGDHMGTTP